MQRFIKLGAAAVTALALATPGLASAATAAPATQASTRAVTQAAAATPSAEKASKIKIKKSEKGVQPGIAKMKLTVKVKGSGKVKFVVKGDAAEVKGKAKIKKGKAVYQVPALGTGKYKVTAKYKGRKGKTKFEVYDSLLTVNQTTFTYSLATNDCFAQPDLTGSIKFKGKPASSGYADVYQDGNIKGGAESPSFLGFAGLAEGGTFDYAGFVCDVVEGGNNTGPHGVGTYFFNVYYTDDAAYENYISSNTITVNIVA